MDARGRNYTVYKLPGKQRNRSAPEKSGGCFIATAVYGSPNEPQVLLFRRFRDEVLSESGPGRALVQVIIFFHHPLHS